MARKAKAKQTEAPQVNIGKEIFESLRELEKLKGIPVDYMVDRLKQALTNAYRKDREDHRDVPAENVVVNLSEEGLSMYQIKTVVDELTDLALEIHKLEEVIEEDKNEIIEILNLRASTKGKMQRYDAMMEQISLRKTELNQKHLRLKSEIQQQKEAKEQYEKEQPVGLPSAL